MYTTLVTAILMASPIFANQLASTDCTGWKEGYPSYYCDCKEQTEGANANRLNAIPFDITVTDTIWYRSSSNIFMEGFVANLYSDCNITMTIMDKCNTDSTKKMFRQIEVSSNQSREVNIDDIKKKAAEYLPRYLEGKKTLAYKLLMLLCVSALLLLCQARAAASSAPPMV